MSELVSYERRDAVSTIVMDDGKMNLQSVAMLEALNAALDRAQADGTVVLLAGREGVFSGCAKRASAKRRKMRPRTGAEYCAALSPELARNWSAASQRRFSSR